MSQSWRDIGEYQERFTDALADLLVFAMVNKIKIRLKDAFRDPRVHGVWGEKKGYGAANSCHKVGLAVDLYTKNTQDHIALHDYWDTLGGARRIDGDMGHYSFEWMGYR